MTFIQLFCLFADLTMFRYVYTVQKQCMHLFLPCYSFIEVFWVIVGKLANTIWKAKECDSNLFMDLQENITFICAQNELRINQVHALKQPPFLV